MERILSLHPLSGGCIANRARKATLILGDGLSIMDPAGIICAMRANELDHAIAAALAGIGYPHALYPLPGPR